MRRALSTVVGCTCLSLALTPTEDEVSGTQVRLAWTIEVDVAAANLTDELRASDAACGSVGRTGWELTVDALTGELLSVAHFCIVC